jgi:hydroxymethylpyrimidine/phosphomethylpyrimidine kinase
MIKNVLSIAGFDPSGCAGILADLKTLMAWRGYGIGVVTAITSQNTQKVENVYPVPMEVIGSQLEVLVDDIEIHAVKIGLLPNAKTIELVAELIKSFKLPNIVIDPVLTSTTGYQFADEKMITAYREKLFPLAEAITPNLEEASVFTRQKVSDVTSMKEAVEVLFQMGPKNVVITGGHLENRAMDVLFDGTRATVFDAPKIMNAHVRGLGCTFSSIMALHLAKKVKLHQAIDPAKKYIARAMVHPFKIGRGRGPLNHNVTI